MKNSNIEWTDHTFNPWIGCAKISPACDHCYAADLSARTFKVKWGAGEARERTSEAYWKQPLKWDAEAAKSGVRTRVFCASLADVFDNEVDPQWRADLFRLIVKTPNLDWMILTKRIGNASAMFPFGWQDFGAPPNIQLGITICNQVEADRDIPKLLRTPAAKRFLSIEPMLGPIDLVLQMGKSECCRGDECIKHLDALTGSEICPGFCDGPVHECVDLVIAGGESGPHARPSHPDWFKSLRDQCASAGVPFMFKQWGEFGPFANEAHYTRGGAEKQAHAWVDGDTGESGKVWLYNDDGLWVNWTGAPSNDADGDVSKSIAVMGRHGKKAAGRLLDGVEHNGVIA